MAQHDVSTAHQEATACHENDGHRFLATSILADRDDGMERLETKWEFKKVQLKWSEGNMGLIQFIYIYILEKTCWDSLKTKQP